MRYVLRLSNQAVRDISDALDFTLKQFGEKQRTQYQRIIRETLEELAADPDNRRIKRRPEIHPDARTIHLGRRGRRARHLFLYRVVDNRFVDVARLLHDSMDLERNMPEDF
jgi:toxin ParE1/3/4